MKKLLFFIILLLISIQANAQAKYIAYKSDMKSENDINLAAGCRKIFYLNSLWVVVLVYDLILTF